MNIFDKTIKISNVLQEKELKDLELFIMAKYIWETQHSIMEAMPILIKHNPDVKEIFNKVIQSIQAGSKDLNNDDIQLVLGLYNWAVRLRLTDEELASLHNKYTTNTLPCQTPCEYINGQSLWINADSSKWIGHGYYWQSGNGGKNTSTPFDYDCLEPNFYFCKKAKVLMADYDLLRNDFATLKDKSEEYINMWLIKECAYISEGQISRFQKSGDTNDYIQIDSIDDFFDLKQPRVSLRQRGFGRATTFIIGDTFSIENGIFKADMICTKGCGTQKYATDFTKKENGLLSMVDAFKEYAFQKLIQRISEITQKDVIKEKRWGTIQSYAIIDIGLRTKPGLVNPGTGYSEERYGLTIRQANCRYVCGPDDPAFYSVVNLDCQLKKQFKEFKNAMIDFGITSEQEPKGEILNMSTSDRINDMDTEWNIQADSSGYRIVDFSQYYALPKSCLNSFWKMSETAMIKGIKLGWSWKYVLSKKEIAKAWFGTDDEKLIKESVDKERESCKKIITLVGCLGMKKPQYCWSWFLEVDDSEVGKWAFDKGTYWNEDCSKNNLHKQIMNLIPK